MVLLSLKGVYTFAVFVCVRTTYAKDIMRIVKNIHQEKKRTSKLCL